MEITLHSIKIHDLVSGFKTIPNAKFTNVKQAFVRIANNISTSRKWKPTTSRRGVKADAPSAKTAKCSAAIAIAENQINKQREP